MFRDKMIFVPATEFIQPSRLNIFRDKISLIFDQAMKNKPCILFIDDIDVLGSDIDFDVINEMGIYEKNADQAFIIKVINSFFYQLGILVKLQIGLMMMCLLLELPVVLIFFRVRFLIKIDSKKLLN